MSEPWIARASQAGKYDRFELHLGGKIYVLTLEGGEKIAREILALLEIDLAVENERLRALWQTAVGVDWAYDEDKPEVSNERRK